MTTFRLRDWQLFLAVHALFIGGVMSPLLLRTQLLSEIYFAYPLFSLYSPKAILSGAAWMNRLNLNGFPTFVSVDFYAMNPIAWLFTGLLPTFDNLHWFIFTNMVAGGVLCAVLLRKMGYSRPASVIGSASYVTANWLLVVTSQFVSVMPVLPLIGLVLLDTRVNFRRAVISSVLLCAYTWTVVFTQVSLMAFAAFAAGAVVMSWRNHPAVAAPTKANDSVLFRRVLPAIVYLLLILLGLVHVATWLIVAFGGTSLWQDYAVGLSVMVLSPLLITVALVVNLALMFRDSD